MGSLARFPHNTTFFILLRVSLLCDSPYIICWGSGSGRNCPRNPVASAATAKRKWQPRSVYLDGLPLQLLHYTKTDEFPSLP